MSESVWAEEEATIEEEENDDGVCCQLCGHRPGDISECGTCVHLACPCIVVPYKAEWFARRDIAAPI